MDIQIGNPSGGYLLVVVALGLLATVWASVARGRAARAFASVDRLPQLLPAGGGARRWRSAILVSLSLSLLALALLDIRWGKTWREVPQKGLEVMFALDVSRSMLAEDASPNRLSRAKQQITDMLDVMAGDRVGLLLFAGQTRQAVPLTSHYQEFKQTLEAAGPHSVHSGGSRLGDALTAAAEGFLDKTNDHKVIVLFTDGEDQESQPVDVARALYEQQGIRIFTVGLGDTGQGARIPETETRRGGYVQYQGQQVWSKLNGEVLTKIATETDGAYIPAGTRRVDMAEVYNNYVANVPPADFQTAKINGYVARFQWFAAPALALLLLEVLLTTSGRGQPTASAARTSRSASTSDRGTGRSRVATGWKPKPSSSLQESGV
ncbi:MAG: VWA domain-containing protein [Planctomycetales bacterium]|nr:VWA domain-containing protein [Planctomycetales bacterium]